MVAGVEMPVESARPSRRPGAASLEVRMLGPLTIRRDGVTLALPASRKVRALLRLSGAGPARRRAQPALRAAVGRPERSARRAALVPQQDPGPRRRACAAQGRYASGRHGQARPGGLLRRCDRDRPGGAGGIETLAPERLRALAALFAGDFLDGLEIDRSPAFNGWLTAQRRRFRGCHAALLEHSSAALPTTRRSDTWRSGWSSRRSTGASTSSC